MFRKRFQPICEFIDPVTQQRRVYNQFTGYSAEPSIVVLDVSWIDYQCDASNWFYTKFPPREILETIARVEVYTDYDPIFWGEVESRLTDDEIQAIDLQVVEVLIESLISYFYQYLESFIPKYENGYVFDQWLDRNTMVLTRSGYNPNKTIL